MDYIIKLENFEGPLDLLLELIKKREMDIYNLQISQITKDYLTSLEEMKTANIDVTADFIEMASLLLEIKAKMLIPVEVEKDDPRNGLVKQLLDYQEYKETVVQLKILREFEQKFYKRQKKDVVRKEKNGSIQDIIRSYKDIFTKKFKVKENKPFDKLREELTKFKFTIEDRMEHLKQLLQTDQVNVADYFSQVETKEEMVVTFGALLELVKLQYIDILLEEEQVFLIKKETSPVEMEEEETNG